MSGSVTNILEGELDCVRESGEHIYLLYNFDPTTSSVLLIVN